MPLFEYVAKTSRGMEVRSSLEAASRHDALGELQTKGLTVVELSAADDDMLKTVAAASAPTPRPRKRRLLEARVSLTDRAIFCRQLSIAVGAGVPLREALESIAEDVDSGALSDILGRITQRLHDGQPFSEAIATEKKLFSPLFTALIRAAEEAGSLPLTLSEMAVSMERAERLGRKIKSVTSYPIFVAVFFCIVSLIMTLFVVPSFEESFGDLNADLPRLTIMVFSFNRFFIRNFPAIAGVLIGLTVALVLYGRTKAGRLRFDAIVLRLPLFGPCLQKFSIARFCRNLAMMVQGGVPIALAMEISSQTCGNQSLERSLLQARERILNGQDISSSLGQERHFPRLVIRMVSIGETSGRLPEVLDKVSDVYEDQVEATIMTAMSLFEPVIICVFGIAILLLVLAIYVPVFTVASHAA